jgi:voltage-gated potassium channel
LNGGARGGELAAAALTARQRRRLVVEATLRVAFTVVVLGTLYYVLPLDHAADAVTVASIVLGCAAIVVVVAWQLRAITRSRYPNVRAVEALAFTIPFYLLLFATVYFVMARAASTNFTAPLTRTDSLYFAVTIFTTVGFGDISAKSEAARLVVTCQMLLDLLLIGVVVKLFFSAITRSQQRRVAPQAEGDEA